VRIVVVTAHPDDYTYGVAGTLLAHADDDRHVVVLAPIQQDAAREVARTLGVELHLLDGEYKKIAANAASLKEQLTSFLATERPDYVFAPPLSGDWSPDHTSAAQIAFESFLDSGSLGQWNARFLRYPIPATTTSFRANVWVELPRAMIET
jgi:LmbE family N-acetylglucosaminyl deacetylase